MVGGVLLIGLLGEGAGHLGHPVVPQPTRAEIGLPGPRLDLPTDGAHDRIWQYFSTDGFPKIPIGNSTFDMPAVDDLRGGMKGFPDKASIEKLRYYGIRTVVLHLGKIKDLPVSHSLAVAEPPDPVGGGREAGRGSRRHTPPGRLERDLRDRPGPEGAARNRLMADAGTPAPRAAGATPSGPGRAAAAAANAPGPAGARGDRAGGARVVTMIQNWSDNQSSHYDLIRALDAGRTTIDSGPYPTKDKAFYKGHYYSARAPGLAIFSLPFYEGLTLVEAPRIARSSPALRGEDEMIDFIGWWGTVLPAFLLMLLVWRVAECFEPGYGASGRGGDGPRHDGAAVLDAAVLARVQRDARLRGVRADDARARRTAARRCCSAPRDC